jgi:tetrahydromethanopterin S-methyltransferase subunit G
MASRYNKSQMSKMAIRDLFIRYGLVAFIVILLVMGLIKSAIKMF